MRIPDRCTHHTTHQWYDTGHPAGTQRTKRLWKQTTESHPLKHEKFSVLKFPCLPRQHHDSEETGVIVGMLKCRSRQYICRLSEKLPCEKEVGGGGLIGTSEIALSFYLNFHHLEKYSWCLKVVAFCLCLLSCGNSSLNGFLTSYCLIQFHLLGPSTGP